MTRRFVALVAWVAGGSLLLAALYWVLLNTPESNVLMLSASAFTLLLMVVVAALTVNTAVLVAQDFPMGTATLKQAAGHFPRFLLGLAIAVALWMLTWRIDEWFVANGGEISAWFIATFNWSDVQWLFTGERWLSEWVRWVLAPVLCVAAVAGRAARHAFSARTLLVSTAAWLLLVVLPWPLTTWRPDVPPTWIEPTVAALRLFAVYALAVIAAAVVISVTALPAPPAPPALPAPPARPAP